MRVLLTSVAVLLGSVCSELVYAEALSVQVRESALRAKPLFYSPSIASVKYGDSVQRITSDAGGWTKVRSRNVEGFIPSTSVTSDVIVISAKNLGSVKADASDVVLAGKGFSREVEQEYKKRDRSSRFDYVDQVERAAQVSRGEVSKFATQGGLNGE